MHGSLVRTRVKCGRKGCLCESGDKHVKLHLSVNLKGRTRGCYVGQGRQAAVAALLGEYERAWRIIRDLTEVNLELLRGEHAGGGRGSVHERMWRTVFCFATGAPVRRDHGVGRFADGSGNDAVSGAGSDDRRDTAGAGARERLK